MKDTVGLNQRGIYSWNYRVVKFNTGDVVPLMNPDTKEKFSSEPIKAPVYAVYEFYYDNNNHPIAMTSEPVIYDFFDSKEELIDTVNMILKDCDEDIIESRELDTLFLKENNNEQ